jgi:hypothetical protein
MSVIVLLNERDIRYTLYEILVLHNIRLRCYCNASMCSTNNGMRSLACGLYVIRLRSESPRLLFQLLPTWKRDFAHRISTRMCNLTCTNRGYKQVNMSIETNITCQVCWECYQSEHSEGNVHTRECPRYFNAPIRHRIVTSLKTRDGMQNRWICPLKPNPVVWVPNLVR